MAALADVNVLVALLHARHVHSVQAVHWLETQEEPGAVAICRISQMGALRILTNPSVMQQDVKTVAEFWTGWQQLLNDDRFAQVCEPAGLEETWRGLSSELAKGKIVETDCYLAASAIAGGHRIASFDRGLRRFAGLDVVEPA